MKNNGLKSNLKSEAKKLESVSDYLHFIVQKFNTQFDGTKEEKQAIYEASEAAREAFEKLSAVITD